ncbi:MAG: 1-acyl-sn-glycerol-3-phosphate acyltransferase [Bacteroidetes bacterium]|nr:1-acyl-sn-glycerol-3-phosphate acyltransferase [Bacteroidota bacterium]
MLYRGLQLFTNIYYRVYYKFEFEGLDKVPKNQPVILAPNHTNGFVDPVIVAMIFSKRVRFFARGDVFKGRLAKWALESMNISPMYRIQEGYAELKKNNKTFEECRQLLTDNKTIVLFPEGICIQERRLRPLKKGLARIAFQTAESFDFSKDILVVPIGLNYTDAKRFGSKAYIDFGPAVSVKEYEAQYKQDKVKAINEFTKMFEEKMKEHLVIIKNSENDDLVSGIEEIYLQQWIKDKKQNIKKLAQHYRASKEIAQMVNELDSFDPSAIAILKENISGYTQKLKENNLRDHLLRPENINKINFLNFLLDFLIIYLGMPIYALGMAFNYPPFFLAKEFTVKKIKKNEFIASVYLNMAMMLGVLYYGIQLLIVALVFRNWLLLSLYAAIIPLLGFYALKYNSVKKKILGRWRLLRMVRKEKKTVTELISARTEVIRLIELAKGQYRTSRN